MHGTFNFVNNYLHRWCCDNSCHCCQSNLHLCCETVEMWLVTAVLYSCQTLLLGLHLVLNFLEKKIKDAFLDVLGRICISLHQQKHPYSYVQREALKQNNYILVSKYQAEVLTYQYFLFSLHGTRGGSLILMMLLSLDNKMFARK